MVRDAKLRLKFDTTLPNGQPIAAEMIIHGRWYSGCMATLEQPAEDPEIDYVRVEAVNFDQHYAEQVLNQWQNEHGLVEEQPDWEIDYN
jgi:hypothetical protein